MCPTLLHINLINCRTVCRPGNSTCEPGFSTREPVFLHASPDFPHTSPGFPHMSPDFLHMSPNFLNESPGIPHTSPIFLNASPGFLHALGSPLHRQCSGPMHLTFTYIRKPHTEATNMAEVIFRPIRHQKSNHTTANRDLSLTAPEAAVSMNT